MKAFLKAFTGAGLVKSDCISGTIPNANLATPNGLVTYNWAVETPATGMRFPVRAPYAMTLLKIEVAGSTIGTSTAPQFDVHMVSSPASAAASGNCILSAKMSPATAYVPVTGALAKTTWAAGRYLMIYLDKVGSAALTKAWITVTAKATLVA